MTTDILVKDAMVTRAIIARPDQTVQEGSEIMRKEDVGSIIENSVPLPFKELKDISPLCSSIILRTIKSPRPVPFSPPFVV